MTVTGRLVSLAERCAHAFAVSKTGDGDASSCQINATK